MTFTETPRPVLACGIAVLAACWLGAAQAADDDPLAVLDEPASAAAAREKDPLAVLDEAAPGAAPDGELDRAVLDDLDPEAARARRRAEPLKPAAPISTAEAARRLYERGALTQAGIAVKVLLRENQLDQQALLLRADLQLARYDGAGAEVTLRRALDARVPAERVLVKLAQALNLQGEYRAVLDTLKPGRLDDPTEQARLLAEQARAHLGLGHVAEAQLKLDEAMALSADAAAPLIGRAVLALRDGFALQARDLVDRALETEPDNGDAWLLLGQIEYQRGNRTAAEVAFGQAISRAPSKWMAAYWRALSRVELGKLDAAERDIALASEQLPGFVGLAYARGRLALARGRSQAAATAFERYLGSMPADANALFYAALAANQLRNHQQALGYLDALADAEGASTRQLWLRARTHMAAGNHGEAARLLADAARPEAPVALIIARQEALFRLDRRDEALALIEQARAAQPDVRALQVAEAKLRFAAGDREAAEAIARNLMQADPADVDALLILGEAALQRDEAELTAEAEARVGNGDAARYHLLEAWRRHAEHPLASPVVARVFAADTDPRQRRRLIADLKRRAPDSPLIEPLQAQTLLDAGRPDKAAELYAAMHERDPDNPRLFVRLVRTMVAAGQREPVIARAEPWMAQHAGDVDIALALADVHADLGHAEPAARWYRRVLELDPDNLFALNDLAVLLTESAPTTAVLLAERAHALAPDHPQVLDTYGAALLAAGDAAQARKLLREAYGYRGSDPGIGLNLARALAADGDPDAARRVLRPLIDDDFTRQAEARALLQRLSLHPRP
ncbi:tetratricopeptide repeat protein [uncultured Thiohalocapsa sp.]|uniref:tetratricopeptide repeat protein n=1 Tax=uncultured Thiohalocapsa sp. TaxID=768990 RepID=UPI0025ED44A7|nr:tetratricopeptide repeat protein [uncultured Thiohalocapsa sp.]